MKGINPQGAEAVLATENVRTEEGRVFFSYRHGIDLRPIAVDETGVFFIGKRFDKYGFPISLYGSGVSNLLGSLSPEVRFALIDGKPYEVSAFIPGSRIATVEDMRRDGQPILVPRILTIYVEPEYRDSLEFMDTDINRANFLVDEQGRMHQIDLGFGIPHFTDAVAKHLKDWNISADPQNPTVSQQLRKLNDFDPELISHLQTEAIDVCPETTEKVRHDLLWSYHNAERMLRELNRLQLAMTDYLERRER